MNLLPFPACWPQDCKTSNRIGHTRESVLIPFSLKPASVFQERMLILDTRLFLCKNNLKWKSVKCKPRMHNGAKSFPAIPLHSILAKLPLSCPQETIFLPEMLFFLFHIYSYPIHYSKFSLNLPLWIFSDNPGRSLGVSSKTSKSNDNVFRHWSVVALYDYLHYAYLLLSSKAQLQFK